MSLGTKINRKEKTKELIKLHEPVFTSLKIDNPLFIPKCAYTPRGMDGLHIGFFESELKKGKDIYTEFVSIDLDPEDPGRNLYKWRYNPHYAEEYETAESNNSVRWLIPASELVKVDYTAEPEKETAFPDFKEFSDSANDASIKDLTVRDLAAIMLRKPVSNKEWLNEIINQ